MKISDIHNGQYCIDIDLNNLLYKHQLNLFSQQFADILTQEKDFSKICRLKKGVLHYTSETLLPLKEILLIFGNPAIHSIRMLRYK